MFVTYFRLSMGIMGHLCIISSCIWSNFTSSYFFFHVPHPSASPFIQNKGNHYPISTSHN
ncbi:hypothetical protein ACE6H2_015630 [Prunus campanulata]